MTEFTDPNAFRAPVPDAPQAPDRSGVFKSLGAIGENLFRLGQTLYQNEQESLVLRAQVEAAKGFQQLSQRAAEADTAEEAQTIFAEGSYDLQSRLLATAMDDRTQSAISMSFEREGIKATANLHATVARRKAESWLASAAEREQQLLQQAAAHPDTDLEGLKEEGDGLWESGWRGGSVTEKTAAEKRLSLRARMDRIKAEQVVNNAPEVGQQLLEERREDGSFANFPDLDPLLRNTLIERAKNGIDAGTANLSEIARTNVVRVYGGKDPLAPDQLRRMGATDAQVQDYAGKVQAGQDAYALSQRAMTAPVGSSEGLMAELEAKMEPGQPNYQYYLEARQWLDNRLTQINRQWMENPAKMADEAFAISEDMPVQARIEKRIGAYTAKGLLPSDPDQRSLRGVPLLSRHEAAEVVQTYRNLPDVSARPAYVTEKMAEWGRFAAPIMDQLLAQDMPYEFAMMKDANPSAGLYLSQTAGRSVSDLKGDYSDPAEATDIERGMRERFNTEFGVTLSRTGNLEQYQSMQDVAVKTALLLKDTDRAYKALFGDHAQAGTNVGVTEVRFPPGITPDEQDRIVAAAERMFAGLEQYNPDTGGFPLSEFKRQIDDTGGFLTYQDEQGNDAGVMLTMGGVPVVDTEGDLIRLSFAEALRLVPEPPEGPPAPAAGGLSRGADPERTEQRAAEASSEAFDKDEEEDRQLMDILRRRGVPVPE